MNNYNTSKDYELLWELAKTQEIICIGYESDNSIRLLTAYYDKSDNTKCVKDNDGYCFISTIYKDDFEKECKDFDLEFILPNNVIKNKDKCAVCKFCQTPFIDEPCDNCKHASNWQPLPEAPGKSLADEYDIMQNILKEEN